MSILEIGNDLKKNVSTDIPTNQHFSLLGPAVLRMGGLKTTKCVHPLLRSL